MISQRNLPLDFAKAKARSTVVEHAGTVIALAEERNGIGIVSKLLADITPNNLYRYPIKPEIHSEIGIIAHDINDLTPVAPKLKTMIFTSVGRQVSAGSTESL